MYKKGFILVSVILFALCIFSSTVFATENAKNAVTNVTDTVIDGTANLANDVREGVGNVENGIEDALDMNGDNETTNVDGTTTENNTAENTDATAINGTTRAIDDGAYTTTRTTADATTNADDSSNMWIWLIVAIASIVIIGLVWYYGAQNTTHRGQ